MGLFLLLGCAEPGPVAARAAWLQEELSADNAFWLTRSPALVEQKYARMAADPYDWMRGTASLFLADQVRPLPDRAPTAFLVTPDSASVLLVGDPHVENLGSCLPGEDVEVPPDPTLTLEWVDLDGAAFGPWTADTRRAAVALALVAEETGCGCGTAMVRAFAEAYSEEIASRAGGSPGWDAEMPGEDGAVVLGLRASAHADGIAGAALDELTVLEPDEAGIGRRRLALDEELSADGDGLLALSPRAEAQLTRLLDAWDARPAGFRPLDAARLYGNGVASLPATRFVVLWDRGSGGLEDDRLLNVREVGDPPSIDGVVPGLGAVYQDNAERIEAVSAQLWSRRDADARMAGLLDGATTFKTTTTSGWFQTFDHETIARTYTRGTVTDADLAGLGAVVGRALASAHARGTTLDGGPALPVIAEDLAAGGPEVFVTERARDAEADLATLYADHALFQTLLDDVGPLLGAEALY
jgi:uncharacterized protein (DUF2252 family)